MPKLIAGNWKKWEAFCWNRAALRGEDSDALENPDEWCIWYTSNRDSTLLEQSNAAVIKAEMENFPEEDCLSESHNHWAVGHVDGWAVRKGTPAWDKLQELIDKVENYPVLDGEDYSRREWEATEENVRQQVRYISSKMDWEHFPDDLWGEVMTYLSQENERELESRDDQGGYPSEEATLEAIYEVTAAWLAKDYKDKATPKMF